MSDVKPATICQILYKLMRDLFCINLVVEMGIWVVILFLLMSNNSLSQFGLFFQYLPISAILPQQGAAAVK